MPSGSAEPKSAPHSQTLDRGLRLLELLAEAERPLAITELAERLGVHRSIAYRILRTLEDHRLIRRGADGLCRLDVGLATLARSVSRDLQSAALPELAAAANELGMTAFIAVPDGDDCVTLAGVEPRHSVVSVAQRPGSRHPLDRGAPGLALLSAGPARADERPDITTARRRGYAYSDNEVIPGVSSIAVPIISGMRGTIGAVAVVFVGSGVDEPAVALRLQQAARAIAAELP
ncbi:IclR family transcriptional regulator [Yinghuangia seranimata]|uniref:IclR family transcriptional regulator n=1 Tax=Yinghuangia seranimata TaxID=408067 RepID=UPI00248BE125|nr:helix-turn-helix domain-containing protein [Yinghuangia seranimata]MDI2130856.1 helix-turn-helix domain-containing protein [Yinghuangia seranimata]